MTHFIRNDRILCLGKIITKQNGIGLECSYPENRQVLYRYPVSVVTLFIHLLLMNFLVTVVVFQNLVNAVFVWLCKDLIENS